MTKNIILTLFIVLSTIRYSLAAVSDSDHQKLLKGEMVQEVVWKEGFVWPHVTVRVLTDHSPAESMNVFMDFNSHKTFIPDMLESKVIKKISSENMHVYMAMEMPWPVKKSTHVTNNKLTKGEDGSYTLSWSLVEAQFLKATDGHITFRPYHGKTLLEYVTFIVPNSSFAGMFKDKVAVDVLTTVKKITGQIDKKLSQVETKQTFQNPEQY